MKRILTVQDISCVGRCSLTVALPIISAAGVEAGVLPTAVLSTHTMFPKFTFCDLTDEIEPISKTFDELGIGFDAIYTGYLGSFRQLGLVSELIDRHKTDNCMVVIDPCMADNGQLYKGFTPEFASAMAQLCGKADLIIPNLTEACFMLGIPYTTEYDEEYIRRILKQLTGLGAKCVEPAFADQFRKFDAQEKKLGVKKDGGDIDAITASTITSRAYIKGIETAVYVFGTIMQTPMPLDTCTGASTNASEE